MMQSNAPVANHEVHLKLLKQAARSRIMNRRKTRRPSHAGNHSSTTTFLSNESFSSDISQNTSASARRTTVIVRRRLSCESCSSEISQSTPAPAKPTLASIRRSASSPPESSDNDRTYEVALKNNSDSHHRPTLSKRRSSLTLCNLSPDDATVRSAASSWESSCMLSDEDGVVGFNKLCSTGNIEIESEVTDVLQENSFVSSASSKMSFTLPTSIQFKRWSLENSTKLADLRDAVHRNIKQELDAPHR